MKRWAMVLLMLLGMSFGLVSLAADFNGDGTGDIAIFRESSGLWAIRGLTRIYFGNSGDNTVPGDYDGNGTDQPAIFRSITGLWAVRSVTRVYFGDASDEIKPGDYDGDGTYDVGIFRESTGLWAVRGVTRIYYGGLTDEAIAPGTVKPPTRTINGTTTVQAAGYYQAFDLLNVQTDLASENIRSGVTIFGLEGDPNVVDTSSGDAIALQIMAGRVAWVDGSEITGILPTRTLNSAQPDQQFGFYSAFNLQSEDEDLAAENIKRGVEIFGVEGTAPDRLLKTGQSFSSQSGDDGDYQVGIAFSYQTEAPNPLAPGKVVTLDNNTGLMWATYGDRAGCFSGQTQTWSDAVTWAEGLTYAGYSDWRLPNIRELMSLVDFGKSDPSISTTYFPNTNSDYYWSSTNAGSDDPSVAWDVDFTYGNAGNHGKINGYYVRAVRGPD